MFSDSSVVSCTFPTSLCPRRFKVRVYTTPLRGSYSLYSFFNSLPRTRSVQYLQGLLSLRYHGRVSKCLPQSTESYILGQKEKKYYTGHICTKHTVYDLQHLQIPKPARSVHICRAMLCTICINFLSSFPSLLHQFNGKGLAFSGKGSLSLLTRMAV